MKNNEKISKTEREIVPMAENQKGIDNHKKAATHFEAAAKSHTDAATHHERGDHEKAAKSAVEAQSHSSLGNEAQKEDVKNHTLKG